MPMLLIEHDVSTLTHQDFQEIGVDFQEKGVAYQEAHGELGKPAGKSKKMQQHTTGHFILNLNLENIIGKDYWSVESFAYRKTLVIC